VLSSKSAVILSEVWRVLCDKRSRRICGFLWSFFSEPQTRDTRTPSRHLRVVRRIHVPAPLPRNKGEQDLPGIPLLRKAQYGSPTSPKRSCSYEAPFDLGFNSWTATSNSPTDRARPHSPTLRRLSVSILAHRRSKRALARCRQLRAKFRFGRPFGDHPAATNAKPAPTKRECLHETVPPAVSNSLTRLVAARVQTPDGGGAFKPVLPDCLPGAFHFSILLGRKPRADLKRCGGTTLDVLAELNLKCAPQNPYRLGNPYLRADGVALLAARRFLIGSSTGPCMEMQWLVPNIPRQPRRLGRKAKPIWTIERSPVKGVWEIASKWGKSWPLGSGKGSAGRVRLPGPGTNAEKIAAATGDILASPGRHNGNHG
jgi:hypothetical protein